MALYKLHDFDPSYRDSFDGDDIKGLDVYSNAQDEKIGKVYDALVDEDGNFRYLIVDMGFWVFGKKVLLPIGQSRIDYNDKRVYAKLAKTQVESLPEFTDDLKLDKGYEDQVRGVYRGSDSTVGTSAAMGTGLATDAAIGAPTMGMDASYVAPMTGSLDAPATGALIDQPGYVGDSTMDSDRYDYDRDADLYAINDTDHQNIRLYQERLLANKQRQKTGEVTVGKRIETDTQRVAVPIEKERVVIERTAGTTGSAVTPGADAFQEGEVARVEVYEETADIHKEAFVREEVQVRKVVDQETVESQETLRREELDVRTDGTPVVDQSGVNPQRPL